MNGPLDASILVVIVNYRTPDLTIECLASLMAERQQLPNLQLVVTDNDSGDNSVEQIERYLASNEAVDTRTKILPLPRNGGFAYGNNAAIRPALSGPTPPDYVLLLNPDTVVRPGGILRLVEFMAAEPRVGIAGSRLEDPDGSAQRSAFRFPSAAAEFEATLRFGPITKLLHRQRTAPPVSDVAIATDWVAGASMIVRRAVFDDIGLMDEQYFMYYEEVDFCFRARQAGWSCWYVPESHVVHLVGQASGVTSVTETPSRRPTYWFESRRRYLIKNLGPWQSVLCDAANLVGLSLWQLRCLVERKPNHDPPHLWWDSVRQSVFLKGFTA